MDEGAKHAVQVVVVFVKKISGGGDGLSARIMFAYLKEIFLFIVIDGILCSL